jgi:hypothetical protein
LYIRCATCHGSVWVTTDGAQSGSQQVACKTCRQSYELRLSDVGATAARLSLRGRQYALDHGIDLPGAYSVLLGIMGLDDVRDLGQDSRVQSAAPAAPDGISVDCDFEKAIAAGWLTRLQALQRGDRKEFASRLAKRHRLPMGLSYAVADNQISVLTAIRRRSASKRIVVRQDESSPTRESPLRVGLLLLVMAVGIGLGLWRPANDASEVSRAEVRTDEQGRVVEVVGSDPRSVLDAYCQTGEPKGGFEAVDLENSAWSSSIRLGILRNVADQETLLAIAIHYDKEARSWIAGDGRTPLIPVAAPRHSTNPAR